MSESNPEESDRLTLPGRVAMLGRRQRGVVRWSVLLQIAGAAGLILLAALLLDWWFELSRPARLFLLAAEIGGVFTLAWYLLRPLRRGAGQDELALQIERARPELQGRLIAAVQLGRSSRAGGDSLSEQLVAATATQAEVLIGSDPFADLVPKKILWRSAWLAAGVALLLGALFLRWPDIGTILIRRAFLQTVAIPKKTRIDFVTGDRRVGRGDSLILEAAAAGIIPESGILWVQFSNRLARFKLDPREKRFSRELFNLQESFLYRIRLNDATTPFYKVTVTPRPQVIGMDCLQEFPPYTGLRPVRRLPSDLSILAGSRLSLRVLVNKEISKATVRLIGPNTRISLQPVPGGTNHWTVTLPIPKSGLSGFALELTDREGMEGRDPIVYPIEIVADQAPIVQLTAPEKKEELLTRRARVWVGFEATDDFAVAQLWFCYKVLKGTTAIQRLELDLGGLKSGPVRRRHSWSLETISPAVTEGTLVEYWVEAMDNNVVTGPSTGSSEHQTVRIVSEQEKMAELLARAGEFIGRVGDVTADQENANKNLGTVIVEKTRTPLREP